LHGLAAALVATGLCAGSARGAEIPPTSPVAFGDLPGLAADDLAAAFATFRASCPAVLGTVAPSRPAQPSPDALKAVCVAAGKLPAMVDRSAASAFFAANFEPRRVAAPAFFTGYYEPVVEGSLTKSAAFPVPLRAAPAGLVAAGAPGTPAHYRRGDGTLAPLPDRAGIEDGALGDAAPPLVWLREPVDAFFAQVQGSARILLPDETTRRIAYAGRNGYAYTSIGKILVDTLHIPPERMGMAELRGWIRDHGQGPHAAGTELMRRNRSYIFFRFDDTLPPEAGPIGAAGISLTPLRSLAVDRSVWPYGLPVYISADLPWRGEAATPFRRLMVAQDTGSAIVGPARGDIFFGTGPVAAARAGAIRHPGTLYVLWPKPAGPATVAAP
jgi:membrane-bound lytic murein transglycosylase A